MNETRKLAAVMFTDIVGYTALMSLDEQKALSVLQKNMDIQKPLVEKFNGKFLKEMGDGTLLCFQSALDAVQCAHEIQQSVSDDPVLNLRIGIHLGDIVFKEGDIYGGGVNVASRIEQLADSGGIYISDQIYNAIRNKPGIKAVFVGEKMLKNISHPVKIYTLLSEPFPERRNEFLATSMDKVKGKSIAVMQFTDMSQQKDQEYFCEGMAEELINALAKVARLQVASRTSAFQFKGKGYDICEIGKKLNVQSVLEGSIRKAGNKLRITAQLVDVTDGYHLWSEKYDRDMEDIFAIQDEISLAIVDNLKIKLLRDEKNELVKRYTENKEAYNLYLKGRYFWNRRSEVGFNKAFEFFQSAIKIDPLYALPYIGIADTYNISGHFCFMNPGEAFEKARKAVKKALEIDASLGEAHSSLAWIYTYNDWNWEKAEQEYKNAIELNPEYATAHEWYALFLAGRGRIDEAITEINEALELDPLSPMINAIFGLIFIFSRRFEEAIEQFRKTIEMNPNFTFAYIWQGMAYWGIGDNDKALVSLLKSETLVKDMTYSIGSLGMAYALAGQKPKAIKTLERMETLSENKYVSPLHKAIIYIGLINKDKAFEYIDKAYIERDSFLFYLKTLPMFDTLRSDPRFIELLKKME